MAMVTEINTANINHAVNSNSAYQNSSDITNPLAEAYALEKSESTDLSFITGLDKNHPVIRYFENLLSKGAPQKGKSSFLVFKGGKYLTIQTKDIAFFYINNDIPTIMSFDKTMYPISFSLDEVTKLTANTRFFRINRQYLVNFAAIKEVEHYFSRKLIVKLKFTTQEKLLVGRDKTTAFLNWLENR